MLKIRETDRTAVENPTLTDQPLPDPEPKARRRFPVWRVLGIVAAIACVVVGLLVLLSPMLFLVGPR